ncbi:hypothetical protein GIB67_023393 [Kingdonia uniflora]|uniref:non-specific serine/threonine protein kinase n=1 Tax=Kingdonia uniflora TaxID=39325 RepID=A0A7J7LIK3_9MAGN|nr:hypothetical protein GIB67_023393 [Kingdonia uniflora]
MGRFIAESIVPTPSKALHIDISTPIHHSPSPSPSPAIYFLLGGIVIFLVCLILLLFFWKYVKPLQLKMIMRNKREPGAPDYFSGNLRTISYFSFRTLKKATRNFHHRNQLGRGGFGPVYKGKLDDGRLIAVKKLSLGKSQQGETEFLAEVRLITSIQHKNLVRLVGCCSDGDQRLLVYEYMKNRSLDLIVYGKVDCFVDWNTRFHIILGIARGLQYLHEDSHLRIIHRDIKASNILLDEKFQAKIGDFGLARFFPEDESYLSTTFAGTLWGDRDVLKSFRSKSHDRVMTLIREIYPIDDFDMSNPRKPIPPQNQYSESNKLRSGASRAQFCDCETYRFSVRRRLEENGSCESWVSFFHREELATEEGDLQSCKPNGYKKYRERIGNRHLLEGYTAPEYAIRGELSEKADIYSFGVLVLEIIGCRKNTDLSLSSDMQYLPEYAWKLYEKSRILDLVDPKLQEKGFVEKDVLQAIHVAFLCLQTFPHLRPPMSEIVAMLTCKAELISIPTKPAFLDRRRSIADIISWEIISEIFPSPLTSDSPSSSRPRI